MMYKKQHSLLTLGCASLLFAASLARPVFAEETKPPASSESMSETVETSKLRFIVGPTGLVLRRAGRSQSGFGGQGAFFLGLNEYWQVGFGIQQVIATSPLMVVYTSFDFRLVYALTGSLRPEKKRLSLKDKEVATVIDKNIGGLRLVGVVSQNLIRLSSPTTSSYAGLGVGLIYDLPSSSSYNFFVGGRYDLFPTSGSAIHSLQGNFGLALWL